MSWALQCFVQVCHEMKVCSLIVCQPSHVAQFSRNYRFLTRSLTLYNTQSLVALLQFHAILLIKVIAKRNLRFVFPLESIVNRFLEFNTLDYVGFIVRSVFGYNRLELEIFTKIRLAFLFILLQVIVKGLCSDYLVAEF